MECAGSICSISTCGTPFGQSGLHRGLGEKPLLQQEASELSLRQQQIETAAALALGFHCILWTGEFFALTAESFHLILTDVEARLI